MKKSEENFKQLKKIQKKYHALNSEVSIQLNALAQRKVELLENRRNIAIYIIESHDENPADYKHDFENGLFSPVGSRGGKAVAVGQKCKTYFKKSEIELGVIEDRRKQILEHIKTGFKMVSKNRLTFDARKMQMIEHIESAK